LSGLGTEAIKLYLNDIHINQKSDTREYTSGELNDIISDVMDQQDWPWKDSGVEYEI